MSIRSRILNRCFNLLYGPLVFLHEPAGVCLFGDAWNGRRRNMLHGLESDGVLLDIGCGAGHLLKVAIAQGFRSVGVDYSLAMLRKAGRRGVPVVAGDARMLPVATGSVSTIVITYPGPWIRSSDTWAEIERVLNQDGRIIILLGGSLDASKSGRLRNLMNRIAYGSGDATQIRFEPPLPEHGSISGDMFRREDTWGTIFRWEGRKR